MVIPYICVLDPFANTVVVIPYTGERNHRYYLISVIWFIPVGYYFGITTHRNYQLLELPIQLVGVPNWLETFIRIDRNYQHSELPTFRIINLCNYCTVPVHETKANKIHALLFFSNDNQYKVINSNWNLCFGDHCDMRINKWDLRSKGINMYWTKYIFLLRSSKIQLLD